MTRLSRDAWAMELAQVTAKRATCLRRSVGCVLLNARGQVLATGYNGVAAGQPHCNELVQEAIYGEAEVRRDRESTYSYAPCVGFKPTYPHACSGAHASSGTNLDGCMALHAEQNALMQCRDPYAIETAYVTTSPCMTCTKLLLNTSCQRIVFSELYPHATAAELWIKSGREWIHYGR